MPLKGVSKQLGIPFIELQSVDSTNKYAMRLVHEGMAIHGMTILAHEQTEGRGQRGKGWESEKNANLTFSVVVNLKPLNTTQLFHLTVCTAVSIWEAVSNIAGDRITIKWPNDIYWDDRKAGGILIENSLGTSTGSTWKWSVIGIGLNVNQTFFSADLPNPVSLKQITGKEYNILEIAKEICTLLDKNFRRLLEGDVKELFKKYREHLYKKNEAVRLRKDNRVFTATIKDVTESGQLVIKHAIEETVEFGKVEWVMMNE